MAFQIGIGIAIAISISDEDRDRDLDFGDRGHALLLSECLRLDAIASQILKDFADVYSLLVCFRFSIHRQINKLNPV